MTTNFRRFLITLTIIIFGSSASLFAQSYSVKVRLVDAKTGDPVSYATVSLTPDGKTVVDKYSQSGEGGDAVIKGVKPGKYTFRGNLLGYEDFEKQIEVRNGDLDLGDCKMKVQVNFLEGATVSDVGNPIVVKKDTIEHNVSLMKSSDNDMLEDILKRLPGVEVSTDGSITANGKTINKIYVDGKQFFLDDPTLASKNLPAKIVEKVRVVEKKSEQAEFTGIDDGEEETVLDLGIKKGMMNGWFGNFMAGGGYDHQGKDAVNDPRYQGAAMVAKFTEDDQLAVIANANNTNNRGFGDMMASSMGGMRGGGMRGGMGGGPMGGGGGMRGNGISSSYMLGFNGGHTWDDKSEIVGNIMGNGNDRLVREKTAKTTFMKDSGTELFATDNSESRTTTYGVRAGARADWKVSKETSLLFEPSFNLGWGSFDEKSDFTTDNMMNGKVTGRINDGNSYSHGESTSQNASGRFLWRQRLGKPGRTLSLNARYQFSKTDLDGLNQSTTNVYGNDPSCAIVDQQYDQLSKSNSLRTRFSYTEPLGGNFYVEGNYSFNYSKNQSSKDTYDKNGATGQYTVRDEEYSSNVTNKVYRHSAGISFKKQEQKYNVTVGANFQPQTTINDRHAGSSIDTTITLKTFNWSPNARVDFNFTDYKMLRLNYRGQSTQPTINQMMPIPDNSNPQKITLGNMSLNPSFSHNMMAMYRTTNTETFASMDANVNFSYNTRSIVNASWYDASGVQYTIPMNNDDGAMSARVFLMFNSPIAKSKFSIMSFTMGNASTGVSFVGKEGIVSDNPDSYLNIKNYDKNSYSTVSVGENIRLIYRNDVLEISLNGGTRYSQTWYEVSKDNKPSTWTSNLGGNVILNTDVINLNTDCRYTFYKGYGEGYNDPTFVWNAEVSKQIFKRRFTVAIKAYDILNQSRNTYRTTQENYVLDTQNNTLGRYIIASLTFRFGTFGNRRGGGHGPMGGGPMGGPGRGPMGPPMGGGHR